MTLRLRKIALLLSDVLMLYIALAVTVAVGFWGQFDLSLYLSHAFAFTGVYVVWLVMLYILDVYDLSTPVTSIQFLGRWSIGLVLMGVVGIAIFYAFPLGGFAPKMNLAIHVAVFGLIAYLMRLAMARQGSRWRIGLVHLSQEETKEIKRVIRGYKHHGYRCIELSPQESLADQIRQHKLHVVVFPREIFSNQQHVSHMYQAFETEVVFLDLPAAFELFARRIPVDSIDEYWFLQHIQHTPYTAYHSMKRLIDIIGAGIILTLSAPLWFLIAPLIKLEDRGPIFYRQTRVGKHGIPFSILKFRTMRTDAEADGIQWASKKDKRVTRVGALLRRTHLDELPQMLNVLRGNISLVGPRPERPGFVGQLEQTIPHYQARHLIKPGFTGWAQVRFRYARSVLDSQKKFEYDLYYMKNRSLMLDTLITIKTLQLLFRGE